MEGNVVALVVVITMQKKYHIMVADDEPAVRQVLRDLILALGKEYIVYTAADSFEALHMMASLPLDLALVDIFMPGLDGFELIKEVRSKYPHLMIVVITGQPSYNMVLEALRLGASDFLAKPISLAELRKILITLKEGTGRQKTAASQPEALSPARFPKSAEAPGCLRGQHFLRALGEKLADIHNPKELYAFLTEMALSLSGGTQALFYLYDQERGRLQLASQHGCAPGQPHPALVNKDILAVQHGGLPLASPSSCLRFPLKLRGELLGVLHVCQAAEQVFQPETIEQLHLLADRFVLSLENLSLQASVSTNLYDTLRALINSLEARDSSTRHHSVRVTCIAAKFAEKINLAPALVVSLRRAGALHDIGKIGIPDAVLLKPGALTPQELEIIRQHPVIGANIVAPLHLLPRERAIVLHHHERWDGKGYPLGLAGEDIPLLCRIIALADSYDAITSDRPYRPRRCHEEALAEIAAHAGTQFDPELTRQFIDIMSRPKMVHEIQNLDAELTSGQHQLSEQQFQQIVRNLPPNVKLQAGGRKTSPLLNH